MQDVQHIKHASAAIVAKFIPLGILLRATVPAALIALVVSDLIDVLFRTFVKHLGYFVTPNEFLADGQGSELVIRRACLLLCPCLRRFIA